MDISDPDNLSAIGTVTPPSPYNNNSTIHCATYRNTLSEFGMTAGIGGAFWYFDLANPRSPQYRTATRINKSSFEAPVYIGNYAYVPTFATRTFGGGVTDQWGDVLSVDLTNLGAATLADTLETSRDPVLGGAYNVFGVTAVNSQTVYAATTSAKGDTATTGNNGVGQLVVLDVSRPTAMSVVKTVSVPGTVHLYQPMIDGNIAVAVGNSVGWYGIYPGGNLVVATFDITDPRNPVLLATLTTNDVPLAFTHHAMAPIGNKLFLVTARDVTKNNTVLMQVDASDPARPKVSNFLIPLGSVAMAVSGNVLYVSTEPYNYNGITAYSLPQPISGGSSGGCTYSLGASSYSAAATAGSTTVNVITQSSCPWTAVSNASWITVSSGASGTANGSVTLQMAANTGAARSGTVTIAGETFTVNQAGTGQPGCSFNVSPTEIHVTGRASSGTFLIVTNTNCAWTATVPSGVTWVTLSPASGTGSGGVGYSIQANTGSARNTTLTVAGTQVPVVQDATASCSYALSSATQRISGVGGSGAVTVTVTGSGCPAWTVSTPSVSWLHVTSAPGQTTTGLATYSVDPNPGSSQRSTTLTIAGQPHSVTQEVAPCSYSLSATGSPAIAGTGGTGSVQVTVGGTVCSWSVTVPADKTWVHITSANNAAGSGTVNFAADVNTTTSARSAALTITGQRPLTQIQYTINQAAGAANTGPVPVITPGGAVNAANFISPTIPAGSIAQGSFFSIFGSGLGPDPSQRAQSYPLGTTLGGVSVRVTQGATSVAAIPVFVAPFQINAVMPSNAPVGTVEVTVSYAGNTSAPVPTQVVVTNFAIFAVAGGRGPGIVQNYVSPTELPLNTGDTSAAPGDTVILWGTGLGPLPNGASDTQPPAAGSLPVTVTVSLGGVSIQPVYSGRAPGLAGVDQVNFVIPRNAPLGCFVPVQISAAGLASNTVTMAIAADRKPCSDGNPLSSLSKTGGKNGTVVLSRLTVTDATKAASSGTVDLGVAVFLQQRTAGALGFDPFAAVPPANSCTYYNNVSSLNSLLVGQLPSASTNINLDAGASVSVAGPNGARGLSYSDAKAHLSPYFGLLGASGTIASSGLSADPLFLEPGAYTVSGSGSADVGPFSFPLAITGGATWSNRDRISTIDRKAGLTIEWSGGDPATQAGLILGLASNPETNVSGSFACLVTLDQHSFTVPSGMIANLPGTAGANAGKVPSALIFATIPIQGFVKFNTSAAPSLDNGIGLFVQVVPELGKSNRGAQFNQTLNTGQGASRIIP